MLAASSSDQYVALAAALAYIPSQGRPFTELVHQLEKMGARVGHRPDRRKAVRSDGRSSLPKFTLVSKIDVWAVRTNSIGGNGTLLPRKPDPLTLTRNTYEAAPRPSR